MVRSGYELYNVGSTYVRGRISIIIMILRLYDFRDILAKLRTTKKKYIYNVYLRIFLIYALFVQ